jgi:uncharacterized membrane protein
MQENEEWITGTILLAISGLVLLPIFLTQETPPVSVELVVLLLITVPLEVGAYYTLLSALRRAPLSLVLPLLAFTPVFTVLTSAAVVGDRVSAEGFLGIGLVTAGAYLLNADLVSRRLTDPIWALVSSSGARRMLLVAFMWSLTSSLGRRGTLLYGALPFGILDVYGMLALFTAITCLRAVQKTLTFNFDRRTCILFLMAGLSMAAMEITHFTAISLAPVPYMISVKRLSLVFGVIIGWIVFGERNIRYRLMGTCVMLSGILFLYDK